MNQQESAASLNLPATETENVLRWIMELSHPQTRATALKELMQISKSVPDLGPMLWHSFGTISALLHEIIAIYPLINPPTLTTQQSRKVCDVLALLKHIAVHPETKIPFLNAHIPLYIYPFLKTTPNVQTVEYLCRCSLHVIDALVNNGGAEVINSILNTEIMPLCLMIMESGSKYSKTISTSISYKILSDDVGLSFVCEKYERFSQLIIIFGKVVTKLAAKPSHGLLKNVVRCYLRLSNDPGLREVLKQFLPEQLRDGTFATFLQNYKPTADLLTMLINNLYNIAQTSANSQQVGISPLAS